MPGPYTWVIGIYLSKRMNPPAAERHRATTPSRDPCPPVGWKPTAATQSTLKRTEEAPPPPGNRL
ncbi:protein of unknown function [Candidatus Promineifilum breve]|uniref:Uncharacterized protein n=1 Tax=Candidatus Promineifilum breve TaxID=1806508 RepID=A0A161JMQ4_9CHLR|nr:protein of unknown function [Candidatus Promineifilum breve]